MPLHEPSGVLRDWTRLVKLDDRGSRHAPDERLMRVPTREVPRATVSGTT